MAPTIKVGDIIPSGSFTYIPYTPALDDHTACGVPVKLSTDEWKGKKVVIFSVPGAFTPTCHVNHLPPYLEKYDQFKAKGVDVIAVVAANDPFVMSGWGRVSGLKDKVNLNAPSTSQSTDYIPIAHQILALSDPNAQWSHLLGLSVDLSARDFGIRTARYALILDDLVVKYAEVEPGAGVTVSGADAVLAHL
ncbi:putative peroxiredoxin [Grifola frondosa]|uniref:Putative peroxiredoxin n=1 Tax=Grifola frondosa TaxID=5627 RepID=A0A1C7MND3_GRIFR|nr:putative peroxiredoxin [Grifola frondosa]